MCYPYLSLLVALRIFFSYSIPFPVGFSQYWGDPIFNPLIFFEIFPIFTSFCFFISHHSFHQVYVSFFLLCLSASPTSSTRVSFFLFLCSYRLSDCLLMPLFLFLYSSSRPLLLTLCSCPARFFAVYPCITVTTLPARAVKLFLGELTCECRLLLRRKDTGAMEVMEKQVSFPWTTGSNEILISENVVYRSYIRSKTIHVVFG